MDTVIEDKLYRIERKANSHVNTKCNPNGSKAAIQFTDEDNILNGPVNLIEVDESELVKTEYVQLYDKPLTFKEIIWRDVIAPALRERLEQALMDGYDCLCDQLKSKVVPTVKTKSKKVLKDMSILAAGIKDGLAGKTPKALELVSESTTMPTIPDSSVVESQSKTVRSRDEIEETIRVMRLCAVTLAACIRMLNNTVMADDGTDPQMRLEIQRNIESLTTRDVMRNIDLLLENRNKALLDDAEYAMLSSFKDGYFLVNETKVPLTMYLDK